MKNAHILPNTEVPIELRKEVYKEALDIIKSWDKNKKKYTFSYNPELCWFLIMVLYGSKQVLHSHPKTHEDIVFNKTPVMFPELNSFLTRGYEGRYTNEERINFLKSVI